MVITANKIIGLKHFFVTVLYLCTSITRSQVVARIADRTASQHLCGSRDVIGHVTIG